MKNMFDISDIGEFNEDEEVNKAINNIAYKYCPANRDELGKCLKNEFEQQLEKMTYNEINDSTKPVLVDLNCICTKNITDFSFLFNNFLFNFCLESRLWAHKCNFDVSEWDVSNAKTMESMFCQCYNFDCDLSRWDVSKVENMTSMFAECSSFNHSLRKWNISSLKKMSYMFAKCKSFNKSLRRWDIRDVQESDLVFFKCDSFDQHVDDWYPHWPHKAYTGLHNETLYYYDLELKKDSDNHYI